MAAHHCTWTLGLRRRMGWWPTAATVISFPEGILLGATHSLSLTGVLGPLGMCQALLDTPPTGILQETGITASG